MPTEYVVAKESHALSSVLMQIDNCECIECVVNPGSQIITMLEEVCHDFSLAYNPSIKLNMQLANGGMDQSLGLAHNVPCQISPIMLYFQLHIICSPAYDILLGHPFNVLTESTVKNYSNKDQTITINDPNSMQSIVVPTVH